MGWRTRVDGPFVEIFTPFPLCRWWRGMGSGDRAIGTTIGFAGGGVPGMVVCWTRSGAQPARYAAPQIKSAAFGRGKSSVARIRSGKRSVTTYSPLDGTSPRLFAWMPMSWSQGSGVPFGAGKDSATRLLATSSVKALDFQNRLSCMSPYGDTI